MARCSGDTLADALGCDPSEVSRWKSGQIARKMSIEDIAKVLVCFGLEAVPVVEGTVSLSVEEHKALLLFAERGFHASKSRAS
jgi:transcriptional regulator with XRE-family HTH domain